MGSLPCGGICPVGLVCDLVSSHLAACNLHDLRTVSMASFVHDTGSHLFFFVVFLQKRFHVFQTQCLAKVTGIMACTLSESTVNCFVKVQFLHFLEFRKRGW